MVTETAAALDAPSRARSRSTDTAVFAGISAIFISQMPIMDGTLLGNVLRMSTVLAFVVLVASRLPLIRTQLRGIELLGMAVLVGIVLLTSLIGILQGNSPQPAEIFRFLGLNLLCFLVGKTLTRYEDCTRYLRLYYLLAVAAAIQGIIALGLDFAGLRQMFAISLYTEADRRYFLPWFGLLGGDVGNYRTNFYFSESSYFAQMLIPAIAYAVACRQRLGAALLIAGFATTSAGAAAVALAGMLLLLLLRLQMAWWLPVAFGIAATAAVLVLGNLLQNSTALFLLLDRGGSVQNKLDTFVILWQQLETYPFGLGPINLSSHFGILVNTSNGLFQLFVAYGVLGLLPLLWMTGALVPLGITRPRGPLSAAMAIGLLGALAAGITHGPLLKYYAMFMLAVTITMARIEEAQAPSRSPRETAPSTASPATVPAPQASAPSQL